MKLDKKPKINIKEIDIDGFKVLIGRDAFSNDHLTFNVAVDGDLWFHRKGVSSSHIIIKSNGQIVPKYIIKKVCEITIENSKKTDAKMQVIYCDVKYVSKKEGMNIGQVLVNQKESIIVNL